MPAPEPPLPCLARSRAGLYKFRKEKPLAYHETKEQRAEYNKRHAERRKARLAWLRAFATATGKDIDFIVSKDPTEFGLEARQLF